jgi:hypothetical protein
MKPLIFGLIILISVLIYHFMYVKEGFQNASNMPSDITDAMTQTMQNMPKDKLNHFIDKLNNIEKIEEPIKQMHSTLNALQELRPYYKYVKFSFDIFLLKFIDAAILNENTFKNDEINAVLSEINRLKMIANITDEMHSEKLLKAKQNASAVKEAEQNKIELSGEKCQMTPSTLQGTEYNKHRCEPPCPNICESDDYIRKDSIPCWNCNLPRSN